MGMLDDFAMIKKSTLVSRNITVVGRRTSERLEPEMWTALREIARREHCKIHDICSLIHLRKNPSTSLTAAIRVFLMLYYRAAATDEGHGKAGHGNFNNMIQRARMTVDMLRRRAPVEESDSPMLDKRPGVDGVQVQERVAARNF
jgi:predicted DNA-binding ribbon-helix-helix protein